MFKLNIRPAACAFALVTTSAIVLPLHAAGDRKAMLTWIKATSGAVTDIPAGNDFDVTITTDTDIDPAATSIDFTLTYNPAVVSSKSFVVDNGFALSNFLDSPDSAGGPDDIVTFSLSLNGGQTWPSAPLDFADMSFRGISRDDRASSDISMFNVVGRDSSGSPVTIPFATSAEAFAIFIVPAPEPASLALLSLSAVPLLLRKRRS